MHRQMTVVIVAALLFGGGRRVEGQVPQGSVGARTLTLGDAARLAGEQGAGTIAARERARQRGALAAQVRADQLPNVSSDAMVDGGTNTIFAPGGSFPGGYWTPISDRALDVRLRVTQRLFDVATVRRGQAASADAVAAQETARAVADQSARAGALAYLRVLNARGTVAARAADSSLAVELLAISRQQLSAGVGIALDVTRAESRLAGAAAQLIEARSLATRAELELKQALGLELGASVGLVDSLREPLDADLTASPGAIERSALSRRSELLAASADIGALHRQISAIAAERLPSVSAYASLASSTTGIFGQRTYGLALSVPIFDGFRREARVAEGRAREREADARLEDAKRRVQVEVRSALVDLSAAKERVAATRVQLGLAEQEVAQARERFRNGIASNADVIAASLTLNTARDAVVDALARYHSARVQLAYAEGTLGALR